MKRVITVTLFCAVALTACRTPGLAVNDSNKAIRAKNCSATGKTLKTTSKEQKAADWAAIADCKAGQKITKFVRFCAAFSIPVVTIVDAKSFSSLKSATKVTSAYAEATTAKISIVKGTAVGAVYVALAGTASGADMVFALENAIISPVNPKALAFIMEPDTMKVPVKEQDEKAFEFAKREFSALNAAQNGYVDDVVAECDLRAKVSSALSMLSSKRVETLPKKHSTI